MKQAKIAVIGSCVCDVIVQVPALPQKAQDINILSQRMALGGCAYTVANLLNLFDLSYVLFAPIGSGLYGTFIREQLAERGMHSMLDPIEEANGCCYCLIEPDGERTFLSLHGAEYRFSAEWFQKLDALTQLHTVYVCGLEIEESTGCHIVEWLKKATVQTIYFAPGPRICNIPEERMQELFDLHVILHINEEEALTYTKATSVLQAAKALYVRTQAAVIITLGEKGALVYTEDDVYQAEVSPVEVVDTIGAGDAHIATIIAQRAVGVDWLTALKRANAISRQVLQQQGASLDKAAFQQLDFT